MFLPDRATVRKHRDTCYACLDIPLWNPERRCGELMTNPIGTMKQDKFLPTEEYLNYVKELEDWNEDKSPEHAFTRFRYGAVYALDRIGEKLGIAEDLKACFPYQYRQMLSVVYYMVMEPEGTLERYQRWEREHLLPPDRKIHPKEIDYMLYSITEAQRQDFLRRQNARHAGGKYLVYDIYTAPPGPADRHAPQMEDLRRLHLLLLYDSVTGQPVCCQRTVETFPTAERMQTLVQQSGAAAAEETVLVLDRRHYSDERINDLICQRQRFVMEVDTDSDLVREYLDWIRSEQLLNWRSFHDDLHLNVFSFRETRMYQPISLRKRKPAMKREKVFIHCYFSPERCTDEKASFHDKLSALRQELVSNARRAEHEALYSRFFIQTQTPEGSLSFTLNESAVQAAERDFGFFALYTNAVKDPATAVQMFQTIEMTASTFGHLRRRLDLRSLMEPTGDCMEGKLFLQYLALLYRAYLKKRMDDYSLSDCFTMQSILDELDGIECYLWPRRMYHLSGLSRRLIYLYHGLGIEVPVHTGMKVMA